MIYLILGRREQGKTTLARYLAQQSPQQTYFDPRGMIEGIQRARTSAGMRAGAAKLLARETVAYAYTPDDLQSGFSEWSLSVRQWIRLDPHRPMAAVVDEAGFLRLEEESWLWALRCSRRDTVHCLMTAHRPVDVPTSIRAIADHFIVFPCRQEHDLAVVRERCSIRAERAVQALGDRQFVWWDDTKGDLTVHRNPETWFVPLGKGTAAPAAAPNAPGEPDGLF